MDRGTRVEIERIAAETLRDAGIVDPPLPIERLLQHVELHRDYYDLANPGFLDRVKHKLRIQGQKLADIVAKVRLQAVLLFDENRICIDQRLPKIKHPWASCHETGHRLLPWHKPFFFGDTAQTLDPMYQADLEAEANYAAGRLLFLGERFSQDARDLAPTIDAVKILAKRYGASMTTTLRRYVEQGPDIAMAMLVSTPPWVEPPEDQPDRSRHFIPSDRFFDLFPGVSADSLRRTLESHTSYRRGGKVADFRFDLVDAVGDRHELRAWSFNNQHYLLIDVTAAANVAAQKYADGMQRILGHLANGFEPNAVRVIVAHTHLANAILAGSERKVHVGEDWAMTPQAIPDTAQYVALGHIHRHQRVEASAPTFYAGSPLQLDFGEVGETKQFLLIEAAAHLPVRVEAIPYEGAVPLADVSGTLQELEHEADRYRLYGHLRVKVQLDQRNPDIARKVRQLLPNAVVVNADVPRNDDAEVERLAAGAAPRDLYAMYYHKEHGRDADPRLLTAFDELRETVVEG